VTPAGSARRRAPAAPATAAPFDLDAALEVVRRRSAGPPRVALVLGSGLGVIAEGVAWKADLPYEEIPGLPRSTVAGHAGRLLLGQWASRPVAIARGRAHLYEGHTAEAATRMVRLLAALGAKALVLTNASGGIAPRMAPGTLALVEDHVNLQWRSPFAGAPGADGGGDPGPASDPAGRGLSTRPIYDGDLLAKATRAAAMAGVPLERGVLGVMTGPSYETPAEIGMLERLGADLVCMSTAPEAAAAAALGLPCIAISCVTNWAAGRSPTRLSHDDVTRAVAAAAAPFKAMLERFVVSAV
jgi:purine-nucleoside phosphorylase